MKTAGLGIDYFGSRPRPALLPLDLLLTTPSLMFRAHVKKIEDSLVTGWKSHSLPAVILRNLKDHGSTYRLTYIKTSKWVSLLTIALSSAASAGIAVSQRKVRQISDPIQQILIQLHKIIYITQDPSSSVLVFGNISEYGDEKWSPFSVPLPLLQGSGLRQAGMTQRESFLPKLKLGMCLKFLQRLGETHINELPPTLHCNLKRRVIERFKKSLFSQQSNPCNLKSEMKKVQYSKKITPKLLQGSPELIEPTFSTSDCHLLLHSSGGNSFVLDDRLGLPSKIDMEKGMTYEQMQTVIEEVLEEVGYYNFTSNRNNYRFFLGISTIHGEQGIIHPEDEHLEF
ncbi:Serine/threonine-protein kinase Nek10 [Varanus komodoensis]|nr:Serine/threonine-protein kinase Nek10 [Varanus komodoensis]